MASFEAVHAAASGKWPEILSELGIDLEYLRNRHGPCPACHGKDRFRFDDLEGRGTWICSQGGGESIAGDGFDLLRHASIARDRSDALLKVSRHLGIGSRSNRTTALLKSPVTTPYSYCRSDGSIAYTIHIARHNDGSKKVWQKTDNGIKPKEDPDFTPLPYRLDELLEWSKQEPIIIVEGEKDADTLWSLGLPATTNSGGAGNWPSEINKWFTGLDIVVIPDNDEKGEHHCRSIIDNLIDTASSVRVCRLPDLPVKGDVSDWLKAGNTIHDLKQQLAQAKEPESDLAQTLGELLATKIEFKPRPHEFIPAGLTMFGGSFKAGKSKFMEWIASEVSQENRVLYLALEYSPHMVQQRFKWMNEKSSKNIRVVYQGQVPQMGDGGELWLDRHLKRFAPKLVVIDSLVKFKRAGAERGYEAETSAMAEIKSLVDSHQVDTVVLHHSRKDSLKDDPNNKFQKMLGSVALSAVPDNLMLLERKDGATVVSMVGRLIDEDRLVFDLVGNVFQRDCSPSTKLLSASSALGEIVDLLATGPKFQYEIADELGLQKSNVSMYVKRLEHDGKVTKNGSRGPVELTEDLF